jgi:hypothetical protein
MKHDLDNITATHLETSNHQHPRGQRAKATNPTQPPPLARPTLGCRTKTLRASDRGPPRRLELDLLDENASSYPEFQHALLLELEGRVRRRGSEFDPV